RGGLQVFQKVYRPLLIHARRCFKVETTPRWLYCPAPHTRRERTEGMRRFFAGPLLGIIVLVLLTLTGTQRVLADPRDFTLVNSTGETITNVYVGPSASTDWGKDILGDDVLGAGQQLNVTFSS